MKKSRKMIKIASVALGGVIGCGALAAFAGCGGGKDAFVIMSEDLNGLFNPFYSTAGTDMDVVGQTQISMLGTDETGHIAFGDKEPVVVKDYEETKQGENTLYTFVLKNGITFSDGVPLTMNDVLFNMYVYLDPAYTGSTTMYSTKIVGLQEYRLQKHVEGSGTEDSLTVRANGRARNRRDFLRNLFVEVGREVANDPTKVDGFNVSVNKMISVINGVPGNLEDYGLDQEWANYKSAISSEEDGVATISDEDAKKQLLTDYTDLVGTASDPTQGLYWKELVSNWATAQSVFSEAPYTNQEGKEPTNTSGYVFDDVSAFLALNGLITIEYGRDANNKIDPNKIIKVTNTFKDSIKTQEEAIRYVFNRDVTGSFNALLTGTSSGQQLYSEFIGLAKDVIMHEEVGEGELSYPNVSGIVSLGHTTDIKTVKVNGHDYTVAHDHDATTGAPTTPDTYDVLQIEVEGSDPKAIWNFGFTVAPWHYYSDPTQADLKVDIKKNKFGVRWSDFKFQTDVLQGNAKDYNGIQYGNVTKNGVPLGAGPYVATDADNDDFPSYGGFMSNNVVYYKANQNFFKEVPGADESLHPPFIEKMRYQVVSSANAIPQLDQGSVDYIEPQLTRENMALINKMDGVQHFETWQLGYGYIGVNAGKIPDINLRMAIMAAMDTSLARGYYDAGTVATIYWPMSLVSWAYPRVNGATLDGTNYLKDKDDYNETQFNTPDLTDESRKQLIIDYMDAAGVEAGDNELKITFTIAGSSLTEHPCYTVFQHAQTLLNECGWNITISPDVNALTKLATGSLAVWAAAWGSTIDPDMYQVYHKNSTATSVLAWGYPEILADTAEYSEENTILTELAEKIDAARETTDEDERRPLYREAMELVLSLAVELPVYQRQVLYVVNSDVIDLETLPEEINPYTSPLSRIWEVKFK